jgi:coproporphyrinogen III oxidase-like Fe-S oxidoreductase
LHIPFCESLCTYSTFHRQLLDHTLAGAYFDALQQDMERAASEGWGFSQVYIGGGTPTVLLQALLRIIGVCQRRFKPDVVSVETNPNHLQSGLLAQLRDVGVKRLSVGVQSLDDGC